MKKWLLAAGVSAVALAGSAYGAGLRINDDICMPAGIWLVRPLGAVERDMTVTACPRLNASLNEGAERGYIRKAPWNCRSGLEPVLKDVIAVPGDTVEMSPVGLFVNEHFIQGSAALTQDSTGKALTHVATGTYLVAGDQVWLLGRNPKAFDSRYFGPVNEKDLPGRAYPVVTR
jgi:conjugative transfer signal peptidase TraF